MTNFCTLFDSNYLTRGMALYRSLENYSPSFHLYILAFDDKVYHFLKGLKLSSATIISLEEFEDQALLSVKPTRSRAEYCWTCTPALIDYCLDKFKLASCTYLDADLKFYADPEILLSETNGYSSLITEHRYSKAYDQAEENGRYCVQFMFFRNDFSGREILKWWKDRCIEWCYARAEDGRFGDQKYLDDWTSRFDRVKVLVHEGGGLAPWNIQQYAIKNDEEHLQIQNRRTGREFPVVFYHFHDFRFYRDGSFACSGPLYELGAEVKEKIYFPYKDELILLKNELVEKGFFGDPNGGQKVSPAVAGLFFSFLKDQLKLLLKGKISFSDLHIFSFFSKHYHLYKTN